MSAYRARLTRSEWDLIADTGDSSEGILSLPSTAVILYPMSDKLEDDLDVMIASESPEASRAVSQ